jgi:hypothetical protein
MTDNIIPAERLEAKRQERERQRREREALAGSILDEEPDQSAPASPAQSKETRL